MTQSNKSIPRIEDIDATKGIGIILVVMGHCCSVSNVFVQWFYAFHLPLFFLASGIIYGTRSEAARPQDYLTVVCRKFRKIMLPYFLFATLHQLLIIVLQGVHDTSGIIENLKMRVYLVLIGNAGSQWFLPAMFLASCLFLLFKRYRYGWIPMLILSVVGIALPDDGAFLLVLFRSFTGLSFIAVGYYISRLWRCRCRWWQLVILLAIQILLALAQPTVSLVSRTFRNVALYYINGIVGTFAILQFSRVLCKYLPRIAGLFQYFGRNTLIILCTHSILIEIARLLDHFIFGDMMPKLGMAEMFIFAAIIVCLEVPVVWLCKRYLKTIFK